MNKWVNWNFLTFETLQPMAGANFASESEYVEWSSISARQFSTRSSAIALSWYSTPLLIEGPVQKMYFTVRFVVEGGSLRLCKMPRLCLKHIIKIMPNIEAVSLWRKSMCSAFLAANVRAGKSLQSDRGNPWTPKARNLTYSISINAKRDITKHTRIKIDGLNRWAIGRRDQWSVSKSEIVCQINVRLLGNRGLVQYPNFEWASLLERQSIHSLPEKRK